MIDTGMLLRAIGAVIVGGLLMIAPPAGTASAQQGKLPSKALTALQERANAHYRSGEFTQALAEAEKALSQAIREFGSDHEQIAIRTYSLGLIAEAAGNQEAAAGYYAHSVRVREKVYGPASAGAAQAMEMLGRVLLRAGRMNEAEAQFQRVLSIRSELVGANHSFTASARADLGRVQLARGDPDAALSMFREAVRLITSEKTEQTVAGMVAEQSIRRQRAVFSGLAAAAWEMGQRSAKDRVTMMAEGYAAAQQAWTTSAASALAKMSARLGATDTDLGRRIRRVQDIAERVLKLHEDDLRALAAWSRVQRGDKRYSTALEEFRQLGIARNRNSAPVVKRQKALVGELQALLKRCPPGQARDGPASDGPASDGQASESCAGSAAALMAITDKLKALNTDTSQDAATLMALSRRMQEAEQALPGYRRFQTTRQARLAESRQLEQVLRDERTRIAATFPEYVSLTSPEPLSIAQTQQLLRPEEVLVAILVGDSESFVWAVDSRRASWARIAVGEAELARQVGELRRGLDPLSVDPATGRANAVKSFDVERAHELYRLVLAPVAPLLAGKSHLLLVPTGPLTSLPFQVLVTDKPARSASADAMLRQARWLIRRHGLSTLPSVQSLNALRRLAPAGTAPRPFIGIGDPALRGPAAAPAQQRGVNRLARAPRPAALYRGGSVDLRALAELEPLPDTATELRSVARALGATEADLLLREAATETRVKQTTLSDYRVVQFATHGLVAGELSGLAEPAIVLTPPAKATAADDGLLGASEIAALELSADWVVLSACNTASGNEVGADALSGLARAFFYAGARALMVSHWAVYSDAAVTLTTGTFATLAGNPRLGRAEAFRRTMLAMIDKGEPPAVWAPFVIVGEAGAPRTSAP